jgi:hypothetical protein
MAERFTPYAFDSACAAGQIQSKKNGRVSCTRPQTAYINFLGAALLLAVNCRR